MGGVGVSNFWATERGSLKRYHEVRVGPINKIINNKINPEIGDN